jgi:CRP/FNR family cyclic AMP-dependent transcriptional regulator
LSIEAAMAAHPFLKDMSPHQCRILTDCAIISHFEPGELILNAGEPADRFYLILKGKVVLKSYIKGFGVVPLQTLGDADVLGWSWLFPPYLWHFDAQAVEPTDIIILDGTSLREECEADHNFGFELIERMSKVIIQRLEALRRQKLELNS